MVDATTYDIMNMRSGIPITGPDSLWPTKGSPVTSILAVSDGPVSGSLVLAQEAAEKAAVEQKEKYREMGDAK
eukprot:43458-Hanusia_phi.AAC.1